MSKRFWKKETTPIEEQPTSGPTYHNVMAEVFASNVTVDIIPITRDEFMKVESIEELANLLIADEKEKRNVQRSH